MRWCWDQWIQEMSLTRRPGSRRHRKTSRCKKRHIVRNARVQPTALSTAIHVQVVPLLGSPVSSQTIRKCLAEGHLGSRRPLRNDESIFNLSSDDNRVRVWRTRGERLNHAFALQRQTSPTAGMMVWGVFVYNTWSPLVLIRVTLTAQQYVHAILQPHVLQLMQRLPGAIFQQDNFRPHTARMSQDTLRIVTSLPWRVPSPDFFPIEHIVIFWDAELGIPRV
ncbi:transposable element Tcb2 transposase [Trichonephila clavipes]|nr:transposable element Tcb2 transposase [Trichonephila clavipes]